MQYFHMRTLKTLFFLFPLMVTGSFKINAFGASHGLPLPMASGENSWLSTLIERETLSTGENVLFDVFILWMAYIVFCFSKNILKKQ